MVSMDFLPDAAVLHTAGMADFERLHPAYIRWSYLRLQVSLRVGETDLLGDAQQRRRGTRGSLPLLDAATWALQRLHNLGPSGSALYDCCHIGWCLHFARSGPNLRINSSLLRASVEVSYTEVLMVWRRFSEAVRLYVREEVPELLRNPYWRLWLLGAPYESIASPPSGVLAGGAIELEFARDAEALRRNRGPDVRTERMAVIEYTYFELSVRFRVAGLDLFQGIEQSGGQTVGLVVPAVGFALGGLAAVRAARIDGRSRYDIPESSPFLRFELASEDVLVQYSPSPVVAQTAYHRLLRAWEQFGRAVCTYLLREVPELNENPEFVAEVTSAGLGDVLTGSGGRSASDTTPE